MAAIAMLFDHLVSGPIAPRNPAAPVREATPNPQHIKESRPRGHGGREMVTRRRFGRLERRLAARANGLFIRQAAHLFREILELH